MSDEIPQRSMRDLVIDFRTSQVEAAWITRPPRAKSLRVLHCLLRRPGELFDKHEILASAWQGVVVGDNVVKVAIRDLRQALDEDAEHPRFIETERGKGYRFVGEVEWLDASRVRVRPAGSAAASVAQGSGRPALSANDRTILGQIDEQFRRVLGGQSRLTALVGPSGRGKTRILDAYADSLPLDDIRVLRTCCWRPMGPEEPYRVLVDLLVALSEQLGPERAASVVSRHAPRWVLELPSLAQTEVARRLRDRLVPHVPARLTREAIDALVELAEQRPLVLLIDDVHDADGGTLDVLVGLLRAARGARIHVVVTHRPESDRSVPMARVLEDRRLQAFIAVLALGSMRRPTGGERHLRLVSTPAVTDEPEGAGARAGWWARLGPDVRRVLEVAALLGASFHTQTLSRVLRRSPSELGDTLDVLTGEGSVFQVLPSGRVGHHDRAFARSGLRDQILDEMAPEHRARLHLEIAEAMTGGEDRSSLSRKRIAGHFEGSGKHEAAFLALREAAESELAESAQTRAFATLCRAHELGALLPPGREAERLAVLDRLIELAMVRADLPAIDRYGSAAYALACKQGDLRSRASALVYLSMARSMDLEPDPEHSQWERDTLVAAVASGDAVARSIVEANRAHLCWVRRGYIPRAEQLCAQGHTLAVEHGLGCAGLLGLGHAHSRLLTSDYAAAHELSRRLSQRAQDQRSSMLFVWTNQLDALAQLRRGRWRDALEGLDRIDECTAQLGSVREMMRVVHLAVWQELGHHAAIVEQAPQSRQEAAAVGLINLVAAADLMHAGALFDLGRVDQARRTLASIGEGAIIEPWRMHKMVLRARMAAASEPGQATEAVRMLLSQASRVGTGERHFMALGALLEAELSLAEDAVPVAMSHCSRALGFVEEDEMLPAAGHAHAVGRRIAQALGDEAAASHHEVRLRSIVEQLRGQLSDRPEIQRSFERHVVAGRWGADDCAIEACA